MKSNERDAAVFLNRLLGNSVGRVFVIWTLKNKDSKFFRSIEKAVRYAIQQATQTDVYVGAGVFESKPSSGRGTINDIVAIPGFWSDIDIADAVHKKSAFLPTMADARRLIRAIGLQPTFIIHSGHGYQVWWLFKKPWSFKTSQDRDQAVALSKRWGDYIADVAAAHGCRVDSVHDLTRVMRVPGTLNRKGKPYVPVKIVKNNKNARYEIADFEKVLKQGVIKVGDAKISREDAELLSKALSGKNGEKFSALWRGDTSGHGDDASAADLALCALLASLTKGDAEKIDRLFRFSGLMRDKWDEKRGDGTYGSKTIQKALEGKTYSSSDDVAAQSQTSELIELAKTAEFFHDANKDAYASVPLQSGRISHRLDSNAFYQWLSYQFYRKHRQPMREAAFNEVYSILTYQAKFEAEEYEVFVRVGELHGDVFIDLGDDTGRVIKVTKRKWEIIDCSPVKFIRPKGMQPIAAPKKGGAPNDIRQFVNISDKGYVLLLAWMVAALHPRGPYPVLVLTGEQGSGKSTVVDVLVQLLDAKRAALRGLPHSERDLMIAAHNNWLVCCDNVSFLPDWLSDAVCRLATGGGLGTRTLYGDFEETIFDVQRPVLLAGIGTLITRGDLLDRALFIHLPRIKGSRLSEREFWKRFADQQAQILGAVLNGLCAALKNRGRIQVMHECRMMDFAEIGVAVEKDFGFSTGTFEKAYKQNRDGVHHDALDASPIGSCVQRVMRADAKFSGTATRLLSRLNREFAGDRGRPKGWPTTPHALSSQLKRIQPNLRALGIEVEFKKSGHRFIHIKYSPKSASSASSAPNSIGRGGRIGRRNRKKSPSKLSLD